MRTNIEIDDKLMAEAMKVSKLKTKKEVVHLALEQYIKESEFNALRSLRGKIEWVGDLDKMRTYDKWDCD